MNRLLIKLKKKMNGWTLLSSVIVILILMPTLDILLNVFKKPNSNWFHIQEFLLKEYTLNSLKIAFFTGIFTLVIGVTLAWLISMYNFPLRNFFKWALILPMAIPAYIAAYTYSGMLSYTGIIQTTLRNNFDLTLDPKYFDIMSINGVIFIFTFFLYPYIFITTKSFLENQSSALIENARILGHKPLSIFVRVILPISRTAIVGGLTLVILEVFSDYGVVNYFGVNTFSTAIFKTWFGMGDIDTAVKLAGILMTVVVALMLFENLLRGRKRYSFTTGKLKPIKRVKLSGVKGALSTAFCFVVFSLGFLIPLMQLIYWGSMSYKKIINERFFELLQNTVVVAGIATIIVMLFAIIVGNFCRLNKGKVSKAFSKIVTLGYSIPGAIIAIGVIVFFIGIDRALVGLYESFGINDRTLVLTGSAVILIFAYVIRYLAVGFNNVEAGFNKVGNKFFEASRMLGFGVTKTFLKVDIHMIKGAVLGGAILTFVDILKELPLTMTLKPFNFETLATQTYKYAIDERLPDAAIPALVIILVSILAIYIFQRIGDKKDERSAG